MKQKSLKMFLTMLVALVSTASYAYDAEINGINYDLSGSATVVSGPVQYSGDITVPSTVVYNGETYSVTSIGDYAFFGCHSLTRINIPNSVTSIGLYAFENCSALTNINIPNSVTSIANFAFHGCSGLTSIEIPSSVTSIGSGAFSDCRDLTSITVSESNAFYNSRENCSAIIETSTNTLLSGCANTIIPENVTSIGDYAFYGCADLKSINIPNSVTSIGRSAFEACRGLTSISIPNGVTSIANSAFCGCYGLTSIDIPNSITSIGDSAFDRCTGLKSINIPNSVTSIGHCAFKLCYGLTNIEIPNSVTSIGHNAFEYCRGLTSIDIPNSVTSIGDGAFVYCSGLTSIEIPNSVTSIGVSAFGYSGLTSITLASLPKGIASARIPTTTKIYVPKAIYNDAVALFPNNEVIALVENYTITATTADETMGSVTGTGEYEEDTEVTLTAIPAEGYEFVQWSDGTTENPYTFTATENKTLTATFSNKYVKLFYADGTTHTDVFEDGIIPNNRYKKDGNITSVQIGSGVTSIGDDAFEGCSGLTSINIPNSVTSIGNKAFDSCKGLTSINIPNSVTSIGTWAFAYCSGLTNINIPNSVTSIGGSAFSNCSGLTSINIPNSVTSIGDYAFFACSGLTSINIPNSVTSIGDDAFEYCSGLTSINIPNSVTSIGEYTFSSCTGLTSINIPNSVASIGVGAFAGCIGLTSVDIPNSVTSIGGGAFSSCSGLTSINIPNSVTSIGDYSFSHCSGLTSINIPNSVTSIGNSAFFNCSALTSIDIPNSVTSIGGGAFLACSGLTSINIPNSVTSIGRAAFCDCIGLTSINIPNSVTSIGEHAFEGCNNLERITLASLPEGIANASIPTTTKIYVPKAIYNDAVALFPNNEVIAILENYTITATTADETMGSVTGAGEYEEDTEVTLTATPAEGYEFVQWSDGTTENPYTFTATENKMLTATFKAIEVEDPNESDTDVARLDNTIYIEPFEAIVGQTAKLSVKMKNNVEVKGFQFDLYLPEGVTVATDEDGFALADLSLARTTKNKTDYFNFGFQRDGAFRVLCGSTKGYTFNDTDGEVCTIMLNIAEDMEEGDFPIILKTVEMTDKGNSPYTTDYLKSTLTVSSYTLGDVNNDGKVTITDFMCAADAILGNVPTPYIERAADFNNDGTVTVSDLMSLADYILSGDAPAKTPARVRQKAGEEQTDNYIYLEPVTATRGGQQTLSVKMKNSESIKGYQVDIYLPDGMTFAQDADGFCQAKMSTARTTTAKTDYFGSNIQSNGALRLLCGSTKGYTFSGNDGEVATVIVNIPEGMEVGDYSIILRNCELTNSTNTAFTNAYSESELTITDGTADEYAEGYNLQIIPFATSNSAANELTLNFVQAEENVTDIEFDIVMPAEMTRTKSGRALKAPAFCNDDRIYSDDHSITMSSDNDIHHVSIKAITNDEYRIIAGEEGSLVTLYFTTAAAAEEGLYDFTIDNITMTCDSGSKINVAPYKGSILIGAPALSGSQVLYGNYAEDATVLNSVAAIQSVTSLDLTEAVAVAEDAIVTTGNKNALIYLAEGMEIANTENVVIGNECKSLVLTDGNPFFAPKSFYAQLLSYRREGVKANGWYSCVVPFNAEIPAGAKVEEFGTFNGTSITLLPLQNITANAPFFFKPADSAFEVTAENVEVAATTSSMFTTGDYTASYETTAAGSVTGKYALKADGSGFGRCDEGAYLVPFRAVLTIDNASNARVIDVDRSTPTSLDAVADTMRNAEVFDIQGRRVANATKAGIYVANGQKYIVK